MRPNITIEQETAACNLFHEAIQYYWSNPEELPAGLRFHLAMNGYGSAAMACIDIANHWIVTPSLARKLQKELVSMQAWKGDKNCEF